MPVMLQRRPVMLCTVGSCACDLASHEPPVRLAVALANAYVVPPLVKLICWFAQFGAPFKLLVCALPHWALAERLSDTDCTSHVGCDFTMPVHVQTAGDAIAASTVSDAELYAIGQSAFRLAGS